MANVILQHLAVVTGPSAPVRVTGAATLFAAQMRGQIPSGTLSGTANLQFTNDPEGLVGWKDLLSTPLTLSSAANNASDESTPAQFPWLWLRVNVLTLSGSGASLLTVVTAA